MERIHGDPGGYYLADGFISDNKPSAFGRKIIYSFVAYCSHSRRQKIQTRLIGYGNLIQY